jgi:hypothetical protein
MGRTTRERHIGRIRNAGEWDQGGQRTVIGLPLQAVEVVGAESHVSSHAGGDVDHVLKPDSALLIPIHEVRRNQRKRSAPRVDAALAVGVVFEKKTTR